ncbi:bZIP transcription factor 1-B-like isoform X2 [Tasmannia lanceolata]|uniref:bZIP transcription factor 1-B-like isoform X2 n=1 Tax=Tasmannia lanceolata TaxID=3420 RepID=UPI0040633EFF
MGNGEVDTPTKTPKSSSAQEQPPPSSPVTVPPPTSPATVYPPDWASFQAYYNSAGTPPIPPPGYFHSSVASSPQGHPYMWGQHMMPPYGTPPPYVTMYPHGGLYAHPSIPPGSHPYAPYAMPSPNGTAEVSVAVPGGAELEGKSVEVRNRSTLKESKGSLGSLSTLTGKSNEMAKASGVSAVGALSQSESGNEGSSEGSDANSQNGSQQTLCCEQGSGGAEAAQNGVTRAPPIQTMVNQTMSMMAISPNGATGPTTNLNIGMDFWGGPAPSSTRGKVPVGAIVPANLMGLRDGVPSDLWLQDEREVKKQRRKQSNRESARRSRLRKQAECEELAKRVETLKEENSSLREELDRIREECEKLAMENASLSMGSY